MSIALAPDNRAHDLRDLLPLPCGSCPERYGRAATWEIQWETVGYAIGGAERRAHVCDVCLPDELRYALEMNVGICPPVASPLPVRTEGMAVA